MHSARETHCRENSLSTVVTLKPLPSSVRETGAAFPVERVAALAEIKACGYTGWGSAIDGLMPDALMIRRAGSIDVLCQASHAHGRAWLSHAQHQALWLRRRLKGL